MSRYQSTNSIIGQFLPKIYTRRITLEDVGNYEQDNGKTQITIDCHIKDVLDENGLGVITRNVEGDNSPTQDEILSALRIVLVGFGDPETGRQFSQAILTLSTLEQPSQVPFNTLLFDLANRLSHQGKQILFPQFQTVRPEGQGLEIRNSLYQRYDRDNNVINMIPYTFSIQLDNDSWNNCDDFSFLCFTYFDFTSLGLDSLGLSDAEANKLSYTVGGLTYDIVTSGGRATSVATTYKNTETGEPYYGPVHYHTGMPNIDPRSGLEIPSDGYIGYMAGYAGADMGPKLTAVQVPVTKIQDFRSFQRTKLVNYQPPQLEYFNNKIPDISFLEKKNKNYFKITDVDIDYDSEERHTNIDFTVDMKDIYKDNSRYYDLVSSIPSLWQNDENTLPIDDLLEILDVKVLRRKMTRRDIRNNKLGGPKRGELMPDTEPTHIVARMLGQSTSTDNIGHIEIVGGDSINTKSFFAKDYEIAKYSESGTVFQYGIEIKVLDKTKSYLNNRLENARISLEQLKMYAEESKVPVFDNYYVRRPEQNAPIGLSEPPSYAQVSTMGNYDRRTNTFTQNFITEARQKYNFNTIASRFMELVLYSVGRGTVNVSSAASTTIQSESEDALLRPALAVDSLDALSDIDSNSPASRQFLKNMIDPGNARPETIDSFLKSFQDLVLEMEDFFGVDHETTISNEGAGYSAKADYGFTVQRWIDAPLERNAAEEPCFVDTSPVRTGIVFNYDTADSGRTSRRGATMERLRERLESEQGRYGALDSDQATISPKSLRIGDVEIAFREDDYFAMVENVRLARERAQSENLTSKYEALLRRKVVLLEPNNFGGVVAVDTFVAHMQRFEFEGNESTAQKFIRVSGDFISGTADIGVQASDYFDNLVSLNRELAGTFDLYEDSRTETTRFTRTDQSEKSSTELGGKKLQDTSQKEFDIKNSTSEYEDDQGLDKKRLLEQDLQLAELNPSVMLGKMVPQISSRSFPSGGIFDRAMRVLTTGQRILLMGEAKDASVVGNTKIALSPVDSVASNMLSTELASISPPPTAKSANRVSKSGPVPASFGTFKVTAISSATTVEVEPANPSSAASTTPALPASSRPLTPTITSSPQPSSPRVAATPRVSSIPTPSFSGTSRGY